MLEPAMLAAEFLSPSFSARAPRPASSAHDAPAPCRQREADDRPEPLQVRTICFLATLCGASVAMMTILLVDVAPIQVSDADLLAVLTGLATLAWLFPIPYTGRTKLYLDTSVILAAVLLLEPGAAMVAVAAGTAIAQVLRRITLAEIAFNTSQTAAQAAVGGLMLALGGWRFDAGSFGRWECMIALAGAGLAMYLTNTFALAAVMSLQSGERMSVVWRESVADTDPADVCVHLSQLSIGLLAATAVMNHPWMLALLLIPSAALYLTYARSVPERPAPSAASEPKTNAYVIALDERREAA